MYHYKKKVDINSGATGPAGRILRTLRLDRSLTTPVGGLVVGDQENVSEDYRKEIRNANLQAEYIKAQARSEMQRHRFY